MSLSTAQRADLRMASGVSALGGVVHGFTRGLDLARSDRQSDERTLSSWTQALSTLGVSELALVTQVHGDGILRARRGSGALDTLGEADAVYTTEPGLAVAVRVADCVPVLLHGPGVVAAVHAGWRGVAAGIVPKAVERVVEEVGCDAHVLHAVIGPAICGRHYEVGPEVVEAIARTGVPERAFVVPGRGPRAHVDGACAVAWQLAAAGVRTVERVEGCTAEDPALPSWRRDGKTAGRMAAIIALRPQ